MHPILFKIGPFCVYSYGVMAALGILTAVFLIERHALKKGLPGDCVVNIVFWVILFGLIGGRIFYVFLNLGMYYSSPLEIIKIYKGGLAFHGSLIFGAITAIALIKKKKLPFLATLDVFAVYVPLAHAIGRIGCFLNGCCQGLPARGFFGVIFPGDSIAIYPTQLYSAFFLFIIFIILFFLERKKQFDGQVISLYCVLYGFLRFNIEFLRADNPPVLGIFTLFQCISAAIFFIGVFFYIYLRNKK